MLSYHSIYKGVPHEEEYTSHYADSHTLVIASLPGNDSQEGQNFADEFCSYISRSQINNLSDLENVVQNGMRQLNAPVELTLSIGYVSDEILYLKTVGDGAVYVRRGNTFIKIIDGDQSASGYVAENDLVVFTTTPLIQAFGEGEIKKLISTNNLQDIVKKFDRRGEDTGQGGIALFVIFKSEPEEDHLLKNISPAPSGKRYVTVVAVVILFAILIWSVLLGYNRRNEAAAQKQIQTSRERITQKLAQSEEVSFLNIARSQALIAEARAEFAQLQSKVGNARKKEVDELAQYIKVREEKILKKEEKNAEEFYDLTIDSKQAKGSILAIDTDEIAILDKDNGIIYLLSLSKKSLEKRKFSSARETSLIGLSNKIAYAYVPGQGIYKIAEDKNNKVIEYDKEWGTIADVALYNGNLYLLDTDKDQVYKYVAAENGFGTKTPYFKGEVVDFPDVASLAIDSSLYMNLEDSIVKYTGGERDAFSTEFPEKDAVITKVLTSKDEEKVYAWNKQKGTFYVLGKSGDYERQVQSSILTKADDIVVYNKQAYILIKEKVFLLDLD